MQNEYNKNVYTLSKYEVTYLSLIRTCHKQIEENKTKPKVVLDVEYNFWCEPQLKTVMTRMILILLMLM